MNKRLDYDDMTVQALACNCYAGCYCDPMGTRSSASIEKELDDNLNSGMSRW